MSIKDRYIIENKLRTVEAEQKQWNGQLPQNVYAGAPIPFLNVSKQ